MQAECMPLHDLGERCLHVDGPSPQGHRRRCEWCLGRFITVPSFFMFLKTRGSYFLIVQTFLKECLSVQEMICF